MRGYWGDEKVTARVLRDVIVPGKTVYKTGDCSLLAGIFSGAPALWDRAGGRATARIGEGPPQQELDLGVGAPQLVCSPPSQSIVDGRV